jgi:hypothetical protein
LNPIRQDCQLVIINATLAQLDLGQILFELKMVDEGLHLGFPYEILVERQGVELLNMEQGIHGLDDAVAVMTVYSFQFNAL